MAEWFTNRLLFAMAAAFATLALLAACGGDDDGGPGASQSQDVSGDSTDEVDDDGPTGNPDASGGPGEGETNVCELATEAEVEESFEGDFNAGDPTNINPFATCLWSSQSFNTVTVTLFRGAGDAIDNLYSFGDGEPVGDLGLVAEWDATLKVLEIRSDENTVVSVSVFDPQTDEAVQRGAAAQFAVHILDRLSG